jgi:hypothetical protein
MAVHDPRPDLVDDAAAWQDLLERAATLENVGGESWVPDGVYWALLGARAIGAELTRTNNGWRLRSRESGQDPDYAAVRPHLQRNVDALTNLLRGTA